MWLLPPSYKLVQLGTKGEGSSNLQRFVAHDPLALIGGGDLMVASHCFRLVRKDTGASAKRKENQSSSSSRKKQKNFCFVRISRTGPRLSGPRPSRGF